jgi:hypothetical protein
VECIYFCHFFASIGYLYVDAGLKLLLIDSRTYAPATANNILLSKDFERALLAFKLVDEALYNRLLFTVETWCENIIEMCQLK